MKPQRPRGFTLLEMLIAVAVLGIAMGAVLSAFARYTDQAAYLRSRTVATWVAHNRLTELALEPNWPDVGEKDDETEMAGVIWKFKVEGQNTQVPTLRRYDVRVYAPGVDRDKKESPSLAYLTGFLISP